MTSPVVAISGLRVELTNGAPIIESVDLELGHGEILGLVGESGSGKTTTALAMLGFARPGARIAAGSVRIGDEEIVGRRADELRRLRGRLISYVPQEPSASLNPSLRIGAQVLEIARARGDTQWREAEVGAALARVHLPHDHEFLRRFPHQLSGGQQQRVALAIALAMEPAVVVLDEPTTGLDVVTQRKILEEIARLRDETRTAMVYVSHDLAAVASVADRIAVMYAGRIVELGSTHSLLAQPLHPYTHGLISSVPDHVTRRRLEGIRGVAVGTEDRPAGCAFAPRCAQVVESCLQTQPELVDVRHGRLVRCTEWSRTPALANRLDIQAMARSSEEALLSVEKLWAVYATAAGGVPAARSVSFSISAGETLALVGESGSGKTTIARCIAGLHAPASGQVFFDGQPLAPLARKRPLRTRRDIQLIFQSPYESLSPRQRIEDQIARPARQLRQLGREQARAEARSLLERVRLPAALARRYPAELSGGERQRVAIARALAAGPRLLVCDEITSALDVSVQAAVIELMMELRAQLGLALLFISHDLGVVASVADRAIVLHHGEVRASGPIEDLLTGTSDTYTRELVEAAPRLPDRRQQDAVVEPMP